MSEDGLRRLAYMRKEQLISTISTLVSEHPVNRYHEDWTVNEFVNGQIMQMRDEILFLNKLITA